VLVQLALALGSLYPADGVEPKPWTSVLVQLALALGSLYPADGHVSRPVGL
jgi:hypothetical protein